MPRRHPKNERIKRAYLQWLQTAKGASESTLDQAAAAIDAFATSIGQKDFARFHREWAMKFLRDTTAGINAKTGRPLSKATIRSRLMAVRKFCKWLADQSGYKSRITHADCEYFNPTSNDARIATAHCERPIPTLEQIQHVVAVAPNKTDIQKRDRALIAFTLLTGMRDNAIASLPLGKVDLDRRMVDQDARVVRTKNGKTMTTFFFPVGAEIEAVVTEYIEHLRNRLQFRDADPLFPRTAVAQTQNRSFAAVGLTREYWTSAASIRRIFRERFAAAGLDYFHPHSFRKTLAHLAYELDLGLAEAKAWSQNLGHEKPMTTWTSYGKIDTYRTGELMSKLAQDAASPPVLDSPEDLLNRLTKHLLKKNDESE